MGKLGKKARKFAKKHLQSVLRKRRKTKALIKKRSSSKSEKDSIADQVHDVVELQKGRKAEDKDTNNISLDVIIAGESDEFPDAVASDSDGYLSEDSSRRHDLEKVDEIVMEENTSTSDVSIQNRKIHEQVTYQMKKLDKLKKKDPKFRAFLESYMKSHEELQDEEVDSDDNERRDRVEHLIDEDNCGTNNGKVLTSSIILYWCQLAKVEHNEPMIISLLNSYRAACHHGSESVGFLFQNRETFCDILMFMLNEADSIFLELLKISSPNCKKETIQEIENTKDWKSVKPLIKSYLRSTLFLLSQVTESEIIAFVLSRLRASLIFFVAFPYLLQRLVKLTVQLWATDQENLSSSSFLVLRDVAITFGPDFFDVVLLKTFKAFITQCRVLKLVDMKHMKFLRDCCVAIYSLNLPKSLGMAIASIRQLSKILQVFMRTKQKESAKKICSWEYVNSVDLWVMFISENVRDFDLQPLLYMTTQLINGVANMFPGPRYFPLRCKCIQWMNNLSRSSGIFIPVTSLVLDVLQYKFGKDAGNSASAFCLPYCLKLPKSWLKSHNFQVQCAASVVELLSEHFSQWSFHISFPELATIPLIHLRKFYEITNTESLRRMIKSVIDQVEKNVAFVQRKRDEVAFSPKDHQSVELFLQMDKCSFSAPFTQYYRSVLEKAALRSLKSNEKASTLEKTNLKRKRKQPSESKGSKKALLANGGNCIPNAKRELPQNDSTS